MAGGIDWFRWHHGSVTDPKFGLIAKKAGARLGDVLAVWAFVLESASANQDRGTVGQIDAEALEFLLGLDDGSVYRILDAMTARGLLGAGGIVVAWEKRQPKREDETAADRKRRQRERQHEIESKSVVTDSSSLDVTQSHAQVTQCHDREEKSREEERDMVKTAVAVVDSCPQQQIIDLYHEALPTGRQVREWTPARAAALRSRWRESQKRQSLDWWRRFFAYCGQSAFLTGQVSTPGRKPFELSLDWLIKPENMAKVIEGAYHESEKVAA